MLKGELIDKIKSNNYSHEQLLGWVNALPGSITSSKPDEWRKGDVLMHKVFKHPYVLIKKEKDGWVCSLLTSEEDCPEILEACNSRFFSKNFITKALFTTSEIQGSFLGTYNNNKHLKEVYNKIKELL